MNEKRVRLFFAVNVPESVKREIAENFLPEIPAEKWRKVLPENLHVTLLFLGYFPQQAVAELQEKASALRGFPAFNAELNGVGHFRGRVLWIGVGKGAEEFAVLCRRLQDAIGVREERFHPHITLARNKGMKKHETDALIETLRAKEFRKEIFVESFELMLSELHKAGPKYTRAFSIALSQEQQ